MVLSTVQGWKSRMLLIHALEIHAHGVQSYAIPCHLATPSLNVESSAGNTLVSRDYGDEMPTA